MLKLMKHIPRKWRVFTYYDKENDDLYEGWFALRRFCTLWTPKGRSITIRAIDPITYAVIRRLQKLKYFNHFPPTGV